MRIASRSAIGILVAGLAGLLLIAAPVAASELDAAKTSGYVGEQLDGYVAVVSDGVPASVKALVEKINAGRRAEYARIAQKNGVAVDVVAAQAGAKLLERAPSGEYVRDATGRWKRKP
jgi:uncharacterized protein